MFDFLSAKFSSIFSRLRSETKLTESNIQEALKQAFHALLEADVPHEVVEKFTAEVSSEVLGTKVLSSLRPSELFLKIVHDKMLQFMGGSSQHRPFPLISLQWLWLWVYKAQVKRRPLQS